MLQCNISSLQKYTTECNVLCGVHTDAHVYRARANTVIGAGHSIKEAEMNAARHALIENGELFMQLQFQKRLVTRIQSARPSFSALSPRVPREQHHRSPSFASVAPAAAPRAGPTFIPMPSAVPYPPSTSSIIGPATVPGSAAARNSCNRSGSFGIPSLLDLQVARPSARAATAPRPELSRPPATTSSSLLCTPARFGAPQPLLFVPGTNTNADARSAINSALAGAGPPLPPPPAYAFRYPAAPFQQPRLSLLPNPNQHRF